MYIKGPTSPEASSSLARRSPGWKRWLKPTRSTRPEAFSAATRAATSAGFRPAGFSTSTCLPAWSAAHAQGESASLVVATITASTSGRRARSAQRSTTSARCSEASARARSGTWSATATRRAPCICAARFPPINPAPMIPTLSTSRSHVVDQGLAPLVVEGEPHLLQPGGVHGRPERLAVVGVEEQEPAAARAHQLAAHRAVAPRQFVPGVDLVRGDALRPLLLVQPVLVHQLAETAGVPLLQGGLDGQPQ